jgi:hypothetical protein
MMGAGYPRLVDGRIYVVALALVLPAILIAVTVAWYSTNPISILVLMAVMLLGGFYLLSYKETFAPETA